MVEIALIQKLLRSNFMSFFIQSEKLYLLLYDNIRLSEPRKTTESVCQGFGPS